MNLKKKILMIILLFFVFVFGSKLQVQAKSYYIDDMKIQATIMEDGNLEIEQTLKYVFNGSYNGIYITIPTKYKNREDIISEISDNIYNASGVYLEGVSVIDNYNNTRYFKESIAAVNGSDGVYTEEDMYNSYKLKVYSPSQDTQKTFKIKYILKDVCVLHNDIGELYYNFIGGDWQCSIKNLDIDVFLPNNKKDIKIWGHGPDNGQATIIDNTHTNFNVKNVPTGKYVAARVVFDKENLPVASKKSSIDALNIIYKDEGKISKISDAKKEYTRNIYIFALILLIYWIILIIKYEKDTKIKLVPFDEDELFKKYNPMLAGCLQGSRDILARDIIAVILNLIEEGKIQLEHINYSINSKGKDSMAYIVSKVPKREHELDDLEKEIYNWLFGDLGTVELSQRLKEMPKEDDANDRFKELNNITQEKLNSIGANQKKVPTFIRVFNTFLFFITIYVAIKHVLYEGFEIYDDLSLVFSIITMGIMMFPLAALAIYAVLGIIIGIRKNVAKLVGKITGQRVVTTTITIIAIFLILIIITAIIGDPRNNYIIADEILICISLIIMLTDNLMMRNSVKMIEDFSKINSFKDKIEEYSMMEDRDIEQVTLWEKYLAYAVSFGIAKKICKRIKGLSLDDDLLGLLNDEDLLQYISSDYSFFYYNASLDSRFMKEYGRFVGDMISGIGSGGGSRRRRWFLWWRRIFWRWRLTEVGGGAF